MRWKARYTRANHEPGTTRLKRVFAWLPTYIDGTVVFLETYEILQSFQVTTYPARLDPTLPEVTPFIIGNWVDISKRLIQ